MDDAGISRRNALKKIGVGVTVAWTAPAIFTVSAQASTGSAPPCTSAGSSNRCATTADCCSPGICLTGTCCLPFGSPCTSSAQCCNSLFCSSLNGCTD